MPGGQFQQLWPVLLAGRNALIAAGLKGASGREVSCGGNRAFDSL